ncbi:IS3 element transposase [Escherichia coli]|nr:IS3 element transposase [Escherichia coli]SQR03791.1 IS3 element transposase [Escherichia coli]SQR08097.1 IS3 element transposase [Escherichia coli]
MKYVFIEKHQAEFSIKAMCRVLRVARSGWYTWCQRRTRISTRQQFRRKRRLRTVWQILKFLRE